MTSWRFAPLWLVVWYLVWSVLVLLLAFAIPTVAAYSLFVLPILAAVSWKVRRDRRSDNSS